ALSGLFGVGGGILIVPALVMFMKMDQKRAHGTSLAAILPIAASGVVGYATGHSIDWKVALALTIGAAGFGAIIGTHLLHRWSHRTVALSFIVILGLTSLRLAFGSEASNGSGQMTIGVALGLLVVGVISGILSGLLGVGGGIVMVPAMVVLFSLPAAIAKGTSLVVVIPTALMGTWRNIKKDNADLPLAMIIGIAGVASSFLASKVSLGLDEQLSNRLFALLLMAVALKMGIAEARKR
ncbi:MAG: sulfite exporter TauE/SafE family protein, partial [Ilumatobacteraceae bacterium]